MLGLVENLGMVEDICFHDQAAAPQSDETRYQLIIRFLASSCSRKRSAYLLTFSRFASTKPCLAPVKDKSEDLSMPGKLLAVGYNADAPLPVDFRFQKSEAKMRLTFRHPACGQSERVAPEIHEQWSSLLDLSPTSLPG